MSYYFAFKVNKKYMKAIEMIRVALQYYEVKDKTESIRYTYKGEFLPAVYIHKTTGRIRNKSSTCRRSSWNDGSSGNGNCIHLVFH